MKKNRLGLLAVTVILVAALFTPFVAKASPLEYGDVLYEYFDEACTYFVAAGVVDGATNVTIENKVDGIPVKVIDYMESSTLKSVTIKKGIKKILKPGFANCPKLKKVTINGYIKTIKKGSFKGVKGVTFTIKANKSQFKKMKKAIKAAGATNCKFKRVS